MIDEHNLAPGFRLISLVCMFGMFMAGGVLGSWLTQRQLQPRLAADAATFERWRKAYDEIHQSLKDTQAKQVGIEQSMQNCREAAVADAERLIRAIKGAH